jgi:serine/threonine protein kinase
VLLNELGEGKLADFGVSGQLADTMAKKHTVIGTPFWMAPEVIQEVGYNNRADIWSLGITCIEMAEGKPPYSNVHPMRAIFMIPSRPPPTLTEPAKWSASFNEFVTVCLTKDPKARPSATELLEHPFVKDVESSEPLVGLIKEATKIIAEVGRDKALGLEAEPEHQQQQSPSEPRKVKEEADTDDDDDDDSKVTAT